MKEIAIHFSPDELRELAKQLYMASFFMLACQYDNEPMVNEIMNKVCATGMAEAHCSRKHRVSASVRLCSN